MFAVMVQLSPFIWLALCSLWVLQPVAVDLHNWLNCGGLIKRQIKRVFFTWKASETVKLGTWHTQKCTAPQRAIDSNLHCLPMYVFSFILRFMLHTWFVNIGCSYGCVIMPSVCKQSDLKQNVFFSSAVC